MRGRHTQTGSPGDRERYTDRFTRREGDIHRQVYQVRGRDTQTGSTGETKTYIDRFTR